MTDHPKVLEALAALRDAASKMRRVVRYFELEAKRVESLGELDARSAEAVEAAKTLTDRYLEG